MTEKYDRIGTGYNSTRVADPFLFSRMEDLMQANQSGIYLDIGCGTGNYTIEFAKKGYSFIGVEPSIKMLETARQRHTNVKWLQGKAEGIPLERDAVNGALASLTLHHWKDIGRGMKELARVIKPGGSLVIFTSDPEQMKGYWLNHYFPTMLEDSIRQMPDLNLIRTSLQHAGFKIEKEESYAVRDDLKDHFLYVGKNHPKLYLEEGIRMGISSFSDLALKKEVQAGLRQLEKDIESGQIQDIMDSFRNKNGDYLFLRAVKS
ncbi:MAG: class I SAM-dependent methyltransferase [Bacteroidia bacterium]|nr:class I SAM-dependent methyltransferase [Bacteroidia bacterium]